MGAEVREVATGKLLLKSDRTLTRDGVRFADAGRRLVALSLVDHETQLLFWDLARPEQSPKAIPQDIRDGAPDHLDVSPDGRWVSVIGRAGAVALYDAAAMEQRHVLHGSMREVLSTGFLPDSRRLVSAATGREAIQIWQVDSGQALLTLPATGGSQYFVSIVEDGNTLLAGTTSRGSWQMWRAPSWEVIYAAEAKEQTEGKQP